MTAPERLLALCTARGVDLEAISRGGLPELTPADVALAARGLPRKPWLACLYSLAGDDSVRGQVRTWLLEALLAEREARQWATKALSVSGMRVRFAEPLVELFLIEERAPARFRVLPELRAIAIGVDDDEWRRVVAHQYAAVAAEYTRALLDGEDWVRRNS